MVGGGDDSATVEEAGAERGGERVGGEHSCFLVLSSILLTVVDRKIMFDFRLVNSSRRLSIFLDSSS